MQQAQRAQTRQAQQEARAAISLKAQQTLDCLIDQWFVPGALGGSNIVPTLISLLGGGRSRPGVLVPSVFLKLLLRPLLTAPACLASSLGAAG